MAPRAPFEFAGQSIAAGTRETVHLPVSVLSDHTPVMLSVRVVHGRRPGPTMFVSAAIHGDEIIGVEIVRRLLRASHLDQLRGTLLAIPIVNTFGFMGRSRYLPDRRDLNRTFPGSQQGSLAGRLAHLFMEEVVKRSSIGIDLHSAAIHRANLPQIRISPSKPETLSLARDFGAPLILTTRLRDGSLRQAAQNCGVDILLYEAGEGLRFDEFSVRVGVTGILRVMRRLEMISSRAASAPKTPSIHSRKSVWQRAPKGGLLRAYKSIGDQVEAGDVLGVISYPFGETDTEIRAEQPGLLIGRSNLPVLNEGDAIFHIAEIAHQTNVEETIEELSAQLSDDILYDEDEIV